MKITVIATGFREVPAARPHRETRHSFAAAHDDAMDFPEPPEPMLDPMPEPHPSEARMSEARMSEARMSAGSSPTRLPQCRAGAEVISLDTMRNALVANFEQDDLDVPAFLRKRGEVM